MPELSLIPERKKAGRPRKEIDFKVLPKVFVFCNVQSQKYARLSSVDEGTLDRRLKEHYNN